jgi:hypothetical protein
MSSWNAFLTNVSAPAPAPAPALTTALTTTPAITTAPAPATAPAVVEPVLSNRHLLLVESTNTISKTEIASAKYDDVDVIYVTRETLYEVYDQMMAFRTMWRSVNLLFHGSANLEDQSISIFGMKMSMNRNIMMNDPQVKGLIRFIKAISLMAHESIYIYTCAVGIADGLKELCIHLDDSCGLKNGIFLSTDNTGNPPSGNWRIEWGTKRGFLVDGLHDNEIEHAQNDLFSDLSGLTFTLLITSTLYNSSSAVYSSDIDYSLTIANSFERDTNNRPKHTIMIPYMGRTDKSNWSARFPYYGHDWNGWNSQFNTWTYSPSVSNYNNARITYVACDADGEPIFLPWDFITQDEFNGTYTDTNGNIKSTTRSLDYINFQQDGNVDYDRIIRITNKTPITQIRSWKACVMYVRMQLRGNGNIEAMEHSRTNVTIFIPNNGTLTPKTFEFNPLTTCPLLLVQRQTINSSGELAIGGIERQYIIDNDYGAYKEVYLPMFFNISDHLYRNNATNPTAYTTTSMNAYFRCRWLAYRENYFSPDTNIVIQSAISSDTTPIVYKQTTVDIPNITYDYESYKHTAVKNNIKQAISLKMKAQDRPDSLSNIRGFMSGYFAYQTLNYYEYWENLGFNKWYADSAKKAFDNYDRVYTNDITQSELGRVLVGLDANDNIIFSKKGKISTHSKDYPNNLVYWRPARICLDVADSKYSAEKSSHSYIEVLSRDGKTITRNFFVPNVGNTQFCPFICHTIGTKTDWFVNYLVKERVPWWVPIEHAGVIAGLSTSPGKEVLFDIEDDIMYRLEDTMDDYDKIL